jgi:hypothetical protein
MCYVILFPNTVYSILQYIISIGTEITLISDHLNVLHILSKDLSRQGKALEIKENDVGRACGTHGRGEKRVQGFGGKARRKKTTWKTEA